MLPAGSARRRCCLHSLLPHAWFLQSRMPAQLGQHHSPGPLSVLPPRSCNPLPCPSGSQHPFMPGSSQRSDLPSVSLPGWLTAPDEPRRPLHRALAPVASLSASGIALRGHPDPQLQIPQPRTGSTWKRLPAQAATTGKELRIHCPEHGTAAEESWPQAKDFTGVW